MELFSELYSTYYLALEQLLRKGAEQPLSIKDMQCILSDHSFTESAYHILPKLQSGGWPLFQDTGNGYSAACTLPPEIPLTHLQLAWLKAVLNDPRIRLFLHNEEFAGLEKCLLDVPKLFSQDDFYMYDRATDGDDYENPEYQCCFRVFLEAIHHKSSVSVQYEGGKGNRLNGVFWPYKLEYSARDDKFRALCYRKNGLRKLQYVLNLGRVVSAHAAEVQQTDTSAIHIAAPEARFREVTLDITKERNALERCMVQFAHFEKRTEYDAAASRYTCTVRYNVMDETELVIRVLSFGPTVRVLGPEHFVSEIRNRVNRQYELTKQYHDKDRD